jgi:hypothetical protein
MPDEEDSGDGGVYMKISWSRMKERVVGKNSNDPERSDVPISLAATAVLGG